MPIEETYEAADIQRELARGCEAIVDEFLIKLKTYAVD